MALTEQRILKSITVLAEQSAVNAQWADQILRDDAVVAETFHRKAYTAEQYHEFLAEVEGAEAYIAVLGWTEPVPVEEIEE
jgi:sulfur carrier protein ThiS